MDFMLAQQAFLGLSSLMDFRKKSKLNFKPWPVSLFTTYIDFAHFVRIVHIEIFSHILGSTKRGTEETQLF